MMTNDKVSVQERFRNTLVSLLPSVMMPKRGDELAAEEESLSLSQSKSTSSSTILPILIEL